MNGEYSALAKAVRAPMRRWWWRTGIWFLLLQAVGWVLFASPLFHRIPALAWLPFWTAPAQIPINLYYTSVLLTQVGFAVLCFGVGAVCIRMAREVFDEAALPNVRNWDASLLRLCVYQFCLPTAVFVAGLVLYTYTSIASGGQYMQFTSTARVVVVEGLVNMLAFWLTLSLWAIGIVAYTGRYWLGVVWIAACLAYPAIDFFLPSTSLMSILHPDARYMAWYLTGAGILIALAIAARFNWSKIMYAGLAAALAMLAYQTRLSDSLIFPTVFMKTNPLYKALLNFGSIDSAGGFFGATDRFFGPSYVTGGVHDWIEITFLGFSEKQFAPAETGVLALLIVIAVNALLIVGQYFLIYWAISGRRRRV